MVTLPSDPTIPSLSELIERVERAEGPDREIDGRIWKIADPAEFDHFCTLSSRPEVFAEHYTASLDAIVGLIERELPGEWSISVDARIPGWFAWIENDQHVATHAEGVGATKALAVCAACLRALSARGGK
jgi:hypothetical protein